MRTLKSRFIFVVMIVILSFTMLMLIVNSSLKQIQHLETTSIQTFKINQQFLNLRKHEKDFIMRKNVKYIEKFDSTFNKTMQLVKQLDSNLIDIEADTSQVAKITSLLKAYRQNFIDFTDMQKKIGLNSKDGLYGSLRKAVHNVESQLKKYKQIQLTADMLMLRRNEKDFMLRLAEKYQAKFLKNLTKFEANLANSDLEPEQKERVFSSLQTYKAEFSALIAAEKIKGLDEKSGLQGSMRAAIHATSAPLKQLQESIILMEESKHAEITTVLWLIAALSILIILTVLIIAISNVLKGVSILTKGIQHTQQTGIFSQPIKHTLRNEFGDIANTYNRFLESISTEIAHINVVLDEVAQGQFNQRVEEKFDGDFETLRINLNNSINSVEFTMNAIGEITDAIDKGQFETRLNDEIKGPLKAKVDHSMKTLESTIDEIQTVMSQVAQGQFDQRIQSELPGHLALLKDSINDSVSEVDRAFENISQYAESLASNDFTHLMTGQFSGTVQQVQNDLNHAMSTLSKALSEVNNRANQVENGANLISQHNTELSSRTQQEAASLEQTAAAMEQIASTVKQSTENSQQASKLIHTTKEGAQNGEQIMQSTINSMHEIQDSSNKIEEIVTLIDSIAFQTNLLALNAAVEAARAGEQGRGFAVVAGEVRSLAGKSSDAAKDIKLLIDEISHKVANGSKLSEKSGEAFTNITSSIVEVVTIVEEITDSSFEQAKGIEEVNQAISNIDSIAQQNANMVENSLDSSNSLKEDSEHLKQLVNNFKLPASLALK